MRKIFGADFSHAETREAYKNEICVLDILRDKGHKHIVRVLRHGILPFSKRYFIDMELCAGTLDDYIRRNHRDKDNVNRKDQKLVPGENTIRFAWDIVRQITSGLEFIHSFNLVHRSLHPQSSMS